MKNEELEIDSQNKILWDKNPIARLKKGGDYLNPQIDIIADDSLDENSKSKLINFFTFAYFYNFYAFSIFNVSEGI